MNDLTMFDLDALLDNFEPATVERGKSYVPQIIADQIQAINQNDRLKISAEIRGTRPYLTEIEINAKGELTAHCTCPVTYECKHAAALLIAADQNGLLNPNPDATNLEQPAKSWLNQLTLAARAYSDQNQSPETSKSKSSPFTYVLQPISPYTPRELTIVVQKVRRLKDGHVAASKAWNDFYGAAFDAKISAEDKHLMSALHTQQRANASPMSFGRQMMNGLPAAALQEIAQTGRFYWTDYQKSSIMWRDEPYSLDFTWEEHKDEETAHLKAIWTDSHGLNLVTDPDAMYVIPSEPPAYFDRNRGCVGLLESRYPFAMLANLLEAPTIPLSMAADLELMLDNLPDSVALPAPATIAREDHYGALQPVLLTQAAPHSWKMTDDGSPQGFARILFDYEGGTVAYSQAGEVFKGTVNHVKVMQHRDRKAEREAVQQFLARCPEFSAYAHNPNDDDAPVAIDLITAPLSVWFEALTAEMFFHELGWQVRHSPSSPLNIHRASAPTIALRENGEAGNDWFSLGMHIEANGQKYNLADLLGSLIEAQPKLLDTAKMQAVEDDTFLFASANDGTKIALRMGDVRPILAHLTDLFSHPTDGDELQLDRYDAMRLLDLQHTLGLAYSGSGRLQRLIDAFHRGHEEQLNAPEDFVGTLRPYQEKGLAWLQFLRESEHGGVLADDMGLGKTAQTLAHVLLEKNQGRLLQPALIVAPTSLMHNWRSEAARFTPTLKVLVLQGTERTQLFEQIAEHDIVLTTYPLLPRDEEVLLSHTYHMVILDEAQSIKNPIAKATQIARKLNTRHRLCLTGTPMENHLGELWSLYHFLMPGFLGSQDVFNKRFRHPIEKHGDAPARKALVARTQPFMLRRRKTEVAKELPPKTTTVVQIEMEGDQQKLYEAIRAAMQAKVQLQIANKGFKRSHIEILDALLKLRQVCCHPSLLKLESVKKNIESAKLKALIDMVSEMVEEGRRILIFSQFTSMLSLIENALAESNIPTLKLIGQTKNRPEVIDAFQNGEAPVFLISLKAGGVGLNLTAADTVIHYDPWWNPAAEDQASDRAWRIGQDKPVFVYKLIIAGSIEERIIDMQERKAALTNSVLSNDSEQAVKFTEEDLLNLLAPLEES